ncbi:hypothetical protein AAKU55_002365 [Oxalobacteraceae bacterium GrIS 1.11]
MTASLPLPAHIHPMAMRATLAASLLLGGLTATAAPVLRCQIDQGGNIQVLDFAPASDPYTAKAVDINGRFRFKAVVIGDQRHLDYIKLYTYGQARRQPVLLHLAKYMAPALPSGPTPIALTGVNYIYSAQRERELQYSCALLEVAP